MCGVDSKKKQREAAARPPTRSPAHCLRLKKEAKDTRRWCIQCKKRKSVVECHSCNVALCISDRGCAEKSYWQLYHEAKAVKSGVLLVASADFNVFSNVHISKYMKILFPLQYAQEHNCISVKNPLKLFNKDRYFLSYCHFCFSHMGALGRR